MSVTQDIESRYVPGKEAELYYTICGAATEAAAAVELSTACPAVYNGLYRHERYIETVHFDTETPDQNIFKARVLYKPLDPTDFVTTFDTTGGSQHITQSPLTVNRYPVSAPDMKGAVGFDGQRVNGTDIVIPAYAFTEQHVKTLAQVNTAYRITLAQMTGRVNDAPFRGFANGEVLFRGVGGQIVTVENERHWQLNFQFACSPNRINLPVGDITVAEKYGWDYLWVLYGENIHANRLIQQPVAAYVERLYPFADFGDLGIGTS